MHKDIMEVIGMPTYNYRCEQCGTFQIRQGIKDQALTNCPSCQNPVKRLIGNNVGVVLKGAGFYSTDNRGSASSSDTKVS